MKNTKKLILILIILFIVLIASISFIGIYTKNLNRMENILPDYLLGMDLKGARQVSLVVSKEEETVVKDSEGNVISDATEEEIEENGYITETKLINREDVITQKNFKLSKSIMEKRMKDLGISSYSIRQSLESGDIILELEEITGLDEIIPYLYTNGTFQIIAEDTNEILMDNKDVKSAKTMYATTDSGTNVYLQIDFNKQGAEKLLNISKEYISKTDEEGNETTENVSLILDGQTITTTYFTQEMDTGLIQLTVGSYITTQDLLQQYISQASKMATLINNGNMEITYDVSTNLYVQSNISIDTIKIFIYVLTGIIVLTALSICIRYKKIGIFAGISSVGLIALLLLIIRYTNVPLTIDGLAAFVLVIAINYIFLVMLLKKINKQESFKINDIKLAFTNSMVKYCFTMIPLYILSIVFVFITFLSIQSFGLILFWGLTLIALYNLLITKTLLINIENK